MSTCRISDDREEVAREEVAGVGAAGELPDDAGEEEFTAGEFTFTEGDVMAARFLSGSDRSERMFASQPTTSAEKNLSEL